MRTRHVVAATVTALTLLGACSGGDDTQAPAPTTADTAAEVTTTEAAPTGEGPAEMDPVRSAREPAVYPDGLQVQVLTVRWRDNTIGNADPGHDAEVHVTVRLRNTGDQPIQVWDGDVLRWGNTLLYGENMTAAQEWAADNDVPRQLVPGSAAEITSVFTLPRTGINTLAYEVSPDYAVYPPVVFTDVEALLA